MKISQINNNNFCLMPWVGLTISTSGGIKPCCEYRDIYNIHTDPPPSDFYNHRDFLTLRRDFLNGKIPAGCCSCFEREKLLGLSSRIAFRRFIEYMPEDYVLEERLQEPNWFQGDIGFSNSCNLKCRMCGAFSSTSWIEDEKKLWSSVSEYKRIRRDKIKIMKNDFNDLNFFFSGFNSIKELYLRGGEPFLATDHNIFLEYLIKKKISNKLTLIYISNGTFIDNKILELLSHFRKVIVIVSLEGLGGLYKYIRGGKYSFERDIVNNIKKISRLKNTYIRFNVTVQAYNILSLAEIYVYINSLNIEDLSASNAFNSQVQWPSYLSPFVLPIELREEACKRVAMIKDFDLLRENLVRIDDNEDDFKLFKSFTKDLDRIRNENVLDVIPELKNYWN